MSGLHVSSIHFSSSQALFTNLDFPPLARFEKDKASHIPKIQNAKKVVLHFGEIQPKSGIEEVLNWQTENSIAHNQKLVPISTDVSEIKKMTEIQHLKLAKIQNKIDALKRHYELLNFAKPDPGMSPTQFQLQVLKETDSLSRMIESLREEASKTILKPTPDPISCVPPSIPSVSPSFTFSQPVSFLPTTSLASMFVASL